MEEATLPVLFQSIHHAMSSGRYEEMDEEKLLQLIDNIDRCEAMVRTEALFSKNETLDDIHTENLKFLFLRYYRAKAYLAIRSMEHRRINVMFAKDSMGQFLHVCATLQLLHEAEAKKMDSAPQSADAKRIAKIEKFKRDKAAKTRMSELSRLLMITKGDAEVDHEEEQRELHVLTLQSFARECLDELDLIEEELKMLKMREEQLALEERNQGDKAKGPVKGGQADLPFGTVVLDPNRPGISMTKTYKVGDQIMMSRETVKVFGTHIAPPTMSLEEFGDLQLQDATERAQREAEATKGPRRHKQLVQDGDEDDELLDEQATMEDRRWDDWKDNNPKGWGNKMGKRY